MEFRIGLVPRAVWRVTKGTPQMYRHAALTEMARERNEAARAEAIREEAIRAEAMSAETGRAAMMRGAGTASAAPLPQPENHPRRTLPQAPLSEREQLRLSLMRKLTPLLKTWRKCPARVCHRARRCASPAFECAALAARRPRTPEQDAAALAAFARALKRRRAELETMGRQ